MSTDEMVGFYIPIFIKGEHIKGENLITVIRIYKQISFVCSEGDRLRSTSLRTWVTLSFATVTALPAVPHRSLPRSSVTPPWILTVDPTHPV